MKNIFNKLKFLYNKSIWIGLLIAPFFFYFGYQHFKKDCESMVKGIKNETVTGKVIDKFIDKENHALMTIIYLDAQDNTEKKLIYANDRSGLINFLEIGDSISKNKGDYKFRVFRNIKKYDFALDFKCGF